MIDMLESKMDVGTWDPSGDYDKAGTVFACNSYQYGLHTQAINDLIDQGYHVVFDNLQECVPCQIDYIKNKPNVMQMLCVENTNPHDPNTQNFNTHHVPMFFWYHDSREFRGTAGDNQLHKKSRTFAPSKKSLTLMNLSRPHRDLIMDDYQDVLSAGLYTYVDKGITLPGDQPGDQLGWNRSVNIAWYNDTAFSIVAETSMYPGPMMIFITEKTFKPIELMHPFMIAGCANSLDLLRRNGFETFDNCFDESYDSINDPDQRLKAVMEQARNFEFSGYDSETLRRMEHNHARFYDFGESRRRYINDVVDPLIEFMEQ